MANHDSTRGCDRIRLKSSSLPGSPAKELRSRAFSSCESASLDFQSRAYRLSIAVTLAAGTTAPSNSSSEGTIIVHYRSSPCRAPC